MTSIVTGSGSGESTEVYIKAGAIQGSQFGGY
jgi:hypothetical protein